MVVWPRDEAAFSAAARTGEDSVGVDIEGIDGDWTGVEAVAVFGGGGDAPTDCPGSASEGATSFLGGVGNGEMLLGAPG